MITILLQKTLDLLNSYFTSIKSKLNTLYNNIGGGGSTPASLIAALSEARGGDHPYAEMKYTFTKSGTFQYITMATGATPPSISDFTIMLNNTPIIPTYSIIANTSISQYPYSFFFDEITVNAGDTLTVRVTPESNRGTQLFIFENSSLANINVIGFVENGDDNIFALNPNCRYFQVYNCKYYQLDNYFSYEWATNVSESRVTPSTYWYGFTYALTV